MGDDNLKKIDIAVNLQMPDGNIMRRKSEIRVPRSMTLLQLLDIASYEQGTIVRGDGVECDVQTDSGTEFTVAPASEGRTIELLCDTREAPEQLLYDILVPYFGSATSIVINRGSSNLY